MNLQNKEPAKEEYQIDSGVKKSDIQLFGEDNQYVIAPNKDKYLFISKRYAITSEDKQLKVSLEDKKLQKKRSRQKGEYWNLILYDFEKNMAEHKIDLYKVAREYNKDSVPLRLVNSYYVGDVHYFRIEIEINQNGNPESKNVYLNLETEKIEELPKDVKPSMNSQISDTGDVTNFSNVLDSRGYINPSNAIEQFTLEGRVPDPDINLYNLYPNLKDKIIDKDWALFIRPDKVTPDEWFDTALHWFASKGEDVLPVYGYNDDWSISDTQIHNSQEAHEWKEAHPEIKDGLVYKSKTDGSENE